MKAVALAVSGAVYEMKGAMRNGAGAHLVSGHLPSVPASRPPLQ